MVEDIGYHRTTTIGFIDRAAGLEYKYTTPQEKKLPFNTKFHFLQIYFMDSLSYFQHRQLIQATVIKGKHKTQKEDLHGFIQL